MKTIIKFEKENRSIRKLILLYILLVHLLYLHYFKETFLTSYNSLLFQYKFSLEKYIFCLFETLCIYCYTIDKIKLQRMTETIVFFLNLMYFIPGVVQQAVTNADWGFMIYYFIFWIGMMCWTKILKPHKVSLLGQVFTTYEPRKYMLFMTGTALGVTLFMSIYMKRFLSLSSIIGTLSDVYGVRAEATEKSVHWILTNFEYWAAYFMVAAIAYFTERKRWIVVFILIIGELAIFVLQGNRIILFLTLVALATGLLKIDNRRLVVCLVLVLFISLIEVNIKQTGFIVTDTFRRFTVVPNRLAEQYYDYFLTHVPDFLRSFSDRIVKLAGIHSPYYSPSIGRIIGQEYYGSVMGANTGLVGGGTFCFGIAGPIISTFGYIYAFRMFERATYSLKSSKMIMTISLFLSSIVINMPALLKGIFSLSYIMMLYLSMIPLSRSCLYRNGD